MCRSHSKVFLQVGQTPISAIKMRPVKILFLCSNRLALPALQELAFFNLLAAVIVPRHCDEMLANVQSILNLTEVPLLVIDKFSYVDQITESFEKYKATVGLIITFAYIIPPSVYILAQDGFYNVHPGPLPSYRGADPVFQQIKNKERQAGVTVHKLAEKFDNGPVIIKEMIRLESTDTHGMLTTKLAHIAARLTMVLVKLIGFDIAVPSKDQDESKAMYYKRQNAKDVIINWDLMDSNVIIALINACNPWNKGASTKINNRIIRFLEADEIPEIRSEDDSKPGNVIAIDDSGLIVSTLHHKAIRVRVFHTDEGFLSGRRIAELGVVPGNRFEAI